MQHEPPKRMKYCHLQSHGWSQKLNKSVRERQIQYDFTHLWDLRNETDKQGEKKRVKL